jgi:hypothetical protein
LKKDAGKKSKKLKQLRTIFLHLINQRAQNKVRLLAKIRSSDKMGGRS